MSKRWQITVQIVMILVIIGFIIGWPFSYGLAGKRDKVIVKKKLAPREKVEIKTDTQENFEKSWEEYRRKSYSFQNEPNQTRQKSNTTIAIFYQPWSWIVWLVIRLLIIVLIEITLIILVPNFAWYGRAARANTIGKLLKLKVFTLDEDEHMLIRSDWSKEYFQLDQNGWHTRPWWYSPMNLLFLDQEVEKWRDNEEFNHKFESLKTEKNFFVIETKCGIVATIKNAKGHLKRYRSTQGNITGLLQEVQEYFEEVLRASLEPMFIKSVRVYRMTPGAIPVEECGLLASTVQDVAVYRGLHCAQSKMQEDGTAQNKFCITYRQYLNEVEKILHAKYNTIGIKLFMDPSDYESKTDDLVNSIAMLEAKNMAIADAIDGVGRKAQGFIRDEKALADVMAKLALSLGEGGVGVFANIGQKAAGGSK